MTKHPLTDGGVDSETVDAKDLQTGDRVTVECRHLPIKNVDAYPTEITGEVTDVDRVDTREFREIGHVTVSTPGGEYTLTYEPALRGYDVVTDEQSGSVFADTLTITRTPAEGGSEDENPRGKPMADGGQTEDAPKHERISEGDTLTVEYSSNRVADGQTLTREGVVQSVTRWETKDGIDTVELVTPDHHCRVLFGEDGPATIQQKSSQWTTLGDVESYTIRKAIADGGLSPRIISEGDRISVEYSAFPAYNVDVSNPLAATVTEVEHGPSKGGSGRIELVTEDAPYVITYNPFRMALERAGTEVARITDWKVLEPATDGGWNVAQRPPKDTEDAVMSVPVSVGGSKRQPRFKLHMMDVEFHEPHPPQTAGRRAERIGWYANAMRAALDDSDRRADHHQMRQTPGVVAWIHVDTEDQRHTPRDSVRVEWVVDADGIPTTEDSRAWRVEYQTPAGTEGAVTFTDTWTRDWFTSSYPGEIHDTSPAEGGSGDANPGDRALTDGGQPDSSSGNGITALDEVLGKRLVAYYTEHDEVMLKFEGDTILQWQGYRSKPLDADEEGLREIWEGHANGEWVETDGDSDE